MGRAVNLISAIVQTIKDTSFELVQKSGLIVQVIDIMKGKSEIKSQIISLIGDIHAFIIDSPNESYLSELCRFLTINIRYNDSNLAIAGFQDQDQSISLCNNACWVVGEIAVSCSIKPSQN